jgi:hypothetical protein
MTTRRGKSIIIWCSGCEDDLGGISSPLSNIFGTSILYGFQFPNAFVPTAKVPCIVRYKA